jgi:glycosyltransferase involved in cell wall biosynthesis
MKLLQINTVLNNSSTGKIVNQIGDLCINNGWESYIAYGGRRLRVNSRSKVIKIGGKFGVYWHALITRVFDRHGFSSTRATERLISKIKQIEPTVIHLHNLHGYYLNVEVLFNYLSKIKTPIIWTLHDCWSFTGHCSHFEYVSCYKWETLCYECPQKHSYPASIFFDNSRINYDQKKDLFNSVENLTIIPVSLWLSNYVSRSFLSNYKSLVIHNGIDLNVFKPACCKSFLKKNRLEEKIIVLGVANVWDKKKGLDDFIRLSKVLDSDFVIILVGVSKQQQTKIPGNIICIERMTSQQELAEIYSCADLYLNLTLEDSYPTTNLEAIACGTPVVTYNTGGSVESIIDDCGYIVDKGDINSVKKILYDIKNKVLQIPSKDRLSSVAHKEFNKDRKFLEYFKLYKDIIAN